MLADLFSNEDDPSQFLYIAYGVGTTAESTTYTALVNESDRALATLTQASTYTPSDTMRFQHLFSEATAGATVSEVGIFTASVGGTMLARKLLDPYITVTANGNILVTYDFIVKDGGHA